MLRKRVDTKSLIKKYQNLVQQVNIYFPLDGKQPTIEEVAK